MAAERPDHVVGTAEPQSLGDTSHGEFGLRQQVLGSFEANLLDQGRSPRAPTKAKWRKPRSIRCSAASSPTLRESGHTLGKPLAMFFPQLASVRRVPTALCAIAPCAILLWHGFGHHLIGAAAVLAGSPTRHPQV